MSRHSRAAALAAAFLLQPAIAPGCSRSGDRPNLVVVTIDTLRADRVGRAAPDGSSLTPEIDRVAEDGVRFSRAFSATNITNPSHLSIFSGVYPRNHAVYGNATRAGAALPTLAERLSKEGYATAGFVSAFHLQSLSGLESGFDAFPAPSAAEVRAAETVDRALAWLDSAGGREPYFLWVHAYDPHRPYEPPEDLAKRLLPEWVGRTAELERRLAEAPDQEREAVARKEGVSISEIRAFVRDWKKAGKTLADLEAHVADPGNPLVARVARAVRARRDLVGGSAWSEEDRKAMSDLYDAEVASADRELGRLFDRARGGRTFLVVTSDHGESLGEHGIFFNHRGIFDSTLHVPLVVAGPGIAGGRVVRETVHLVDLVPTVLELLGRGPARGLDGESIAGLALATRQTLGPRPLFHENSYGIAAAVRDGRWKFVLPVPVESLSDRLRIEAWHDEALFDLEADPDETADASGRDAAVRVRLEALLREFQKLSPRFPTDASSAVELSPEDRERLKQLGYVY